VTIFVGCTQKNLPLELVQSLQRFGNRLEWLKVEGSGANALDFHIAYHLGCLFSQCREMECVVLSKDGGFDPLVRHLKNSGLKVRRISSLLELNPQASTIKDTNYVRVVELLSKTEKRARPRKRSTLTQHISAMFGKKLPEVEVQSLVDTLFSERKVMESQNALTYTF
jgi:hypothetical protein